MRMKVLTDHQQTIQDLRARLEAAESRAQTLAIKCREWESAAMGLLSKVNIAESERDCARRELAAKKGGE